MIGLTLATQQRRPWWPVGALFAADFVGNRYMIGGVSVDRNTAFSFTRASSKLAQDSTGVWRSFATNVPAITDRGILLEPERQNTVINSCALEAWNLLRAAVTPNSGPGLDASNGADLLTATDTNVNGAFAGTNSQTVVPGTIYTFSTILRRVASDWIALVVSNADNSHRKTVWFNLSTATIGATATTGTEFTLTSSGIDSLPDGTRRCWISMSTATLTGPIFRLYLVSGNNTFAVTAGANVEVVHGQIEASQSRTSPILALAAPSTGSSDCVLIAVPGGTTQVQLRYATAPIDTIIRGAGPFMLPTTSEWLQTIAVF